MAPQRSVKTTPVVVLANVRARRRRLALEAVAGERDELAQRRDRAPLQTEPERPDETFPGCTQ
jgi:hypothetical protein